MADCEECDGDGETVYCDCGADFGPNCTCEMSVCEGCNGSGEAP
jgi:hypothetical protein